MIIFLYGQDTYRAQAKLKELINHYQKSHKTGLNLRFLDGKKISFQGLKEEILTQAMFKEKKLIILKDVFSNQAFKKDFLKEAKEILNFKDTVLFHEEGEVNIKDPLFVFLKKQAKFQEFNPLFGKNLENWVKKEIKEHGAKAEKGAIEKLIKFLGNDLWRLSSEIKKLAVYKQQSKPIQILKEDVELLVKPNIETGIFKAIDFLASKKKKEAILLFHKHLEKGDSPLYLLTMINFQFRNILTIKEMVESGLPYFHILKQSSLRPFVVDKAYYQSEKFTLNELKKIYRKLFQIDIDVKTGKIKPEIAIDLLVAKI
ncbi:MAG TPA: DNA polymerase III subunit delta [Candidatus Parcubacteria bacterium]|jgi:DNA polymerase-3 subunit delta|nr:DNA polymerase III subunit delta [Candidatus Parcubacteria bacterium]